MPAKWYKPTAIVLTLWMALGVVIFCFDLMQTAEQVAALPEPQRLLREARPLWLMIVFGIATITGLAGSVALVLRHRLAPLLLLVSLVAVTLQFGYTIFGMRAIELIGPAHALGLPGFIFLMGALSLWVGVKAANENWLR